MKPYGVNEIYDRGCCPGHDKFPSETYNNNRSIRARSRDKKVSHQIARAQSKHELVNMFRAKNKSREEYAMFLLDKIADLENEFNANFEYMKELQYQMNQSIILDIQDNLFDKYDRLYESCILISRDLLNVEKEFEKLIK